AFRRRAAQCPLRHAHVAIYEMTILGVGYIRDTCKPRAQSFLDGCSPHVATSPRIWAARHLQHAVLTEVTHNPIKIMRIEGFEYGFENLGNGLRAHSITSSARARSAGGNARPSSLAVFRLIRSSNLIG